MSLLAASRSLLFATFISLNIVPRFGQAQDNLPPARNYHKDQYGQDTKVVKERYSDDSQGEKQGIYLLYNQKGQIITKYTYVHGVKNGPGFIIGDDWFYSSSFRLPIKSIGSFVNGKEQGWWEVYNVNFNGETRSLDRRMHYVSGNLDIVTTYRDGKESATYQYSSDKKNGPAKLFGATTAQYATAQFANNEPTGTWRDAGVKVEKGTMLSRVPFLVPIYRKGGSLTYTQGKLTKITEPGGRIRTPEQLLQQEVASQAPATQAPTQPDFYSFQPGERTTFDQLKYTTPDGAHYITGAELLTKDDLKTALLAQYLQVNRDPTPTRLLLKASKVLGANPTKLLITNGSLTWDQLFPVIHLESPQLDGELLYYGLRGSEEEKGHGSSLLVQRILLSRRLDMTEYKQELAANFYRCARAAHDAYSDTNKYPLRRWLYEEYSPTDSDPLKWMNMVTKSDPQSDQVNFPKLYGN